MITELVSQPDRSYLRWSRDRTEPLSPWSCRAAYQQQRGVNDAGRQRRSARQKHDRVVGLDWGEPLRKQSLQGDPDIVRQVRSRLLLCVDIPLLLFQLDDGVRPNEPNRTSISLFIFCKLLICGAPGQIRTADLLVRSQTLYPTELRARFFWKISAKTLVYYRCAFVLLVSDRAIRLLQERRAGPGL
jgi:hypothetical protein